MIRLLKLSNNKDSKLNGEDILSIHLGYFLNHGKVTYSTCIAIADKPNYVILTLGNINDICYVCHVVDHAYKEDTRRHEFLDYAPEIFKNDKNDTLLMFDSMQIVAMDFLDELLHDRVIHDFIKERANNKTL